MPFLSVHLPIQAGLFFCCAICLFCGVHHEAMGCICRHTVHIVSSKISYSIRSVRVCRLCVALNQDAAVFFGWWEELSFPPKCRNNVAGSSVRRCPEGLGGGGNQPFPFPHFNAVMSKNNLPIPSPTLNTPNCSHICNTVLGRS